MTPSHVDSRGIVTTASTRRGLVKTPSRRPRHVQSSKKNAESAPSSSCAAPRRPTSRAPAARKPRRWAPRKLRVDGSTAAGASSRASSAISSTRHYCRRRKRLVLGPLGLGNARRWFAVRKAQGPKLALRAAATVQLTGFWLALACGRSRSCPLMVARADARSAGHGRTTLSTKLVSRGSEPLRRF